MPTIKRLLTSTVLLATSALAAGVANAEEQVFTLQVWAPDEVPAIDAKHVEIGEGYYYRYDPEVVEYNDNTDRKLEFTFADPQGERYQFRWITASSPGDVSLTDVATDSIHISIDDGTYISDSIYFELWVLDTQTGERFMCDPQFKNRPRN